MFYVYLIRSVSFPTQVYIGITEDFESRLEVHNFGGSPHTAKYKPWDAVVVVRFKHETRAREFEKYLKSGSGNAFAKKRLW